jgi:hypothetical protein
MSYLGRSAKLSAKSEEKVSFLATSGQTSKTGLSYTTGFVEVHVNGILLTDGTDYTAANGNSITFTVALTLNDEVTVVSLKTFALADHYTKSASDTLLAAKVDDSQVLTNVPSGALFTDTTYSVGDGGLTQKNFTTADNTKLTGIEASATADQTNAEIRAAVEAATDSNAFTDADHTKLNGIATSANNYTLPSGIATETYVGTEISNLVDSSPAALNTLNELAAALGDDANHVTTMTNLISAKLSTAGGTMTGHTLHGDNVKAKFGAGSDLEIYHDSNHSYISDVGTGALKLKSDDFRVENSSGTNLIKGVGDVASLYHAGVEKLATTSSGVDISGTVVADYLQVGEAGSDYAIMIKEGSGGEYYQLGVDNYGGLVFYNETTKVAEFTDASTFITQGDITANGVVIATDILSGSIGTTGEIQLGKGTVLTTGAGTYDTSVRWNGSGGNLLFSQGATEKMRIGNYGVDVTGTVTAAGGSTNNNDDANILTLNASEHARLLIDTSSTSGHRATLVLESNGNETTLSTTGSNSYLTADAGQLFLKSATSNVWLNGNECGMTNAADTEYLIRASSNGSVKLYYDGVKKLETTSTGIDVTGTVVADGLTVNTTTSAEISGAVSGNYILKLDNTHATSGNGLRIETPSTASNEYSLVVKSNNGANNNLTVANNGDISFYEDTGTTPKFYWDASAQETTVTALNNTTTTYPLKVSNSAGSLVTGYGAYGISMPAGSEYTMDINGDLVIDAANVGIGTSSPVSSWLNNFDPSTGNGTFKQTTEGWITTPYLTGLAAYYPSQGARPIIWADASGTNIQSWDNDSTDGVSIKSSDGTTRLVVGNNGDVTPGADNTQDFGSTSKRWANIYTGDLHLSNKNTKGNSVDGTTGDWTIQEGEDNLYIINNKNGKKFKLSLEEVS